MSKPNNIWKNERNFDDESLKKQRYFFVAEHNDLISKARH
ncbi:replication initiation protein, partial [Tetragenococcus halophilus]|nr:replication initiation protein [Tetragenococcus halophilus]